MLIINAKNNKVIKGEFEGCEWDNYSYDRFDSWKNKELQLSDGSHKKETNTSELLFYLEEAYEMDLLDEKETDIYERYSYGELITNAEWQYVNKKYSKWNNIKF